MTDEKDNVVTGNDLPKSLCSQVCEECQQPDFKGTLPIFQAISSY